MGLPSGNTGGANNGVGTAGSLDGDAGTASSTVSGVHGSSTGFKAGASTGGAGGPVEGDPAQGGGKQTR